MEPIYYTNHLEKLVKLYPYKPWVIDYIKANPNVTPAIIKDIISCHTKMHLPLNKPDYPVCVRKKEYQTYDEYYYEKINECKRKETIKDITIDDITIDDIDENFTTYNHLINEAIMKYPNFKWNFYDAARNIHLKIETVKTNMNKSWHWGNISGNPNITWETIKNNPNLPWSYGNMPENPNLTWDVIKEYPNLPLEWGWCYMFNKEWDVELLKKIIPRMNEDTIKKCFYHLSDSCKITWDIIEDNPDYPWNWDQISRNPNITWDIVYKNINKNWNWKYLSLNEFEKCKEIKRKHNKHNSRYYLNKTVLYKNIINIIVDYIM